MFFSKNPWLRGWSHVSHLRAQHSVKIAVCLPQIAFREHYTRAREGSDKFGQKICVILRESAKCSILRFVL
jgi:hypothetical protein